MLRKSFFNAFSALVLALAVVAFFIDVVLQAKGDADVFAPAVLLLMWLVGGLVRLFYEKDAKRGFDRHMEKSPHATVWKQVDGCWVRVDANLLMPGDKVLVSAGMLCPVDAALDDKGRVVVSEASLTGESGVSAKRGGDVVFAGTTITDGRAVATVLSGIPEATVQPRIERKPTAKFGGGAKSVCFALVKCMLVVLPLVIMVRGVVRGDWPHALLFALGTAVGLVPEMLPVITSICLSGSARRLKRKQVIVKNVDTMESLGAMDVVCVDKTGTLTDDVAVLEYYTDILSNESLKTLNLAYLECACQGSVANQLDRAIAAACDSAGFELAAKGLIKAFPLLETDPFDHLSRTSGVKAAATPGALGCLGVQGPAGDSLTVVKGEVEAVCARCSWADFKGQLVPMDADGVASALDAAEEMRTDGIKVLAVAYGVDAPGWDGLVLCGFLGFFDAPKESARAAVKALSDLSVQVRVLSGDSASVVKSTCSRLGIPVESVITGSMLAEMTESEALAQIGQTRVFAELAPAQKADIVDMIRLSGHAVGYIGDGVNDVPALMAADVGIVVDSAAAESKKVADLVLLERDLGVVAEGVREGRKAFANASKYIRIASSSNFGNICSVAAASAFLPFLPATVAQLLVLNLSFDAVCLAMPWDSVDAEEVKAPKTWSGKGLGGFMGRFGLVSSAFDIITFAILFFAVCPAVCGAPFAALDEAGRGLFVALFQAGWLLECAWTESLVVLSLRTRHFGGLAGRPCRLLRVMVPVMLAASALLLLGPAAPYLGLASLPAWYLAIVALLSALYLAVVAALKRAYLSRAKSLF